MPSRRSFLRTLGAVASTAILTPERVLADPYRILRRPPSARIVRVRGVVRAQGRGLSGVAVSDGFDVVATQSDGTFELVTRADREFVALSVPRGHELPSARNGTAGHGTARHFRRIVAGSRGEAEAVFDLAPLEGADENHTALFLPDVQTEDRYEMDRFQAETAPDLEATVADLGGEVFGVSVGDIMYDDLTLYPDYEEGVARAGVPFFQCIGNHDLDFDGASDEASTATFSGRYGPRYYSYDRGAVHYVVLDDVLWHGSGYIGYLGYDQLHWLEADLARVEPGSPVIVATHIPVVGSRHERDGEARPEPTVSIGNREVLYRLLEPFEAHVISGHTHENDHIWADGVHEHVSGTVCGAWWTGDICADGTPNGYSVYEVHGTEVRWRYKATGRPVDHQMRLYARGSDPRAPEEFVANVWDADEAWRVVWYEDGQPRGLMARRQGLDPRSVREHAGEDLPERRSWVDPYPTRHLYYAPVAADHGVLRVEATDRFGRTYSAGL
ncbi:MAG: hypothetical protein HKN71_13130 [Gemmatimonadetes bacterium]|nr:hypothetical protein [Gemmatimonadota bacterium]